MSDRFYQQQAAGPRRILGRKASRGQPIGAEIKGLSALQQQLAAMEPKVTAKLKQILLKGGQKVAEQAFQDAPYLTGELRGSIDVRTEHEGLHVIVHADAPHAHLLEFGTVKAPARPFMLPAYKKHRRSIQRAVRRELRAVLGKRFFGV